ncbi:MAG: benzoyl-CoA reductase subunit A [Planctomycetes bacterium]|nr:benzoyl-CoA reductase subunit A [Planctomycetota bacterium]
MKGFVGIDLGSTTTKAVVLDDQGRILGRGITNSRSNYEVACAVAREEAFADVRFTSCERALPEGVLDVTRREAFLDALARAFRLAWHRERLDALAGAMRREVPVVEALFAGPALGPHVDAIVLQMRDLAEPLYAKGAPRRSDFFRDVATSQFHTLGEAFAKRGAGSFERLMAVFDKAILKAENQESHFSPQASAEFAIGRALAELDLDTKAAANSIVRPLLAAMSAELETVQTVGTGYGRATLPFSREQIRSEILCHGLGAHAMFPGTRTVLDIGGQDTKAIQVDANGLVTSFQMNDRCAAGCGRYLGYIADEMNLGLHELGPLAQKSCRPVRINSTCTVFAGAEIRDRLTLGQKREDILAGLHRAVILRAMSLLARSGGVHDEFTFTGGVAKNETAVKVLRDLVTQNYGERTMNVSPNSIYTGALGAALFARRTPARVMEAVA